ncbi:MAG TPA: AsmA family protein, partial [Cyclobacteriaceae bacterium]|nr:AsmA family protein [Cyclobacteriaceae bacterium]
MARVLRWFSYLIAFVVLLLAIAYSVAQFYKPRILETINREVATSVNGSFHVGGLDFTIFERFPNFSLTLSDIYLRGPRYDQFAKDVFTAGKIYVHVNPLHLIRGVLDVNSIAIEEGTIYIFRTKDGYINTDAFKPKDGVQGKKPDSVKTNSPLALDLSNIRLKNTRFAFIDSLKAKSFDVTFQNTQVAISSSDTSRLILLNGPMYFGGLTFNEAKGGYLSNTQLVAALNLEFRPLHQKLVIHPSSLNFGAWHVDLTGNFGFAAPGLYDLSIKSDHLLYGEGVKVVTRVLGEKLSRYHFEAPLKLDVAIVGTLAPGDQPRVDINFTTEKNQFRMGKIVLDDLAFKGSFSNHIVDSLPYTDPNSAIRLDTLWGKVKRLPFDAKISLVNLTDPDLHINFRSNVRLTELNRESDDSKLKFSSGVSRVTFSYDGKLKEYL